MTRQTWNYSFIMVTSQCLMYFQHLVKRCLTLVSFLSPHLFFLSKIRVGLTDVETQSQCGGGALLLGMVLFLSFVFGCPWSLLLPGLLSGCGEQGLLCRCSVQASRGGFSCCRAWALGHVGSVAVVHWLWSTGSIVVVQTQLLCGIWDLPRPGTELALGGVDSLPLSHQGSPSRNVLFQFLGLIFFNFIWV